MKNFIQRAITGILFVAVILSAIFFQPEYKTLSFLFAVVTALGLHEFYQIVNKGMNLQVPVGYSIACGV